MNSKKAAMEVNYVVMVILALLVLALVGYFIFNMGAGSNAKLGAKVDCPGSCISDCANCMGTCNAIQLPSPEESSGLWGSFKSLFVGKASTTSGKIIYCCTGKVVGIPSPCS
ncbi:hypothetical protein HN419_02005 [Candidatus Woesearchaeota archaeon]|jgi:hypothetical protein|nr:hypothetical protein [Candidatus Woesearchaeota archaeon]MBT3537229.1 hypothetical protein [Candidatus Woesearchaeota archaeon]MBT4698216.1 hypothetical protein [Candidatus Woesearchaeota archaeon]MBT4717739.1 hypothetical protein [Candidatus Woesearchaeota archaeon]MBT7106461.1 hypothetical protein [Candidatus Woesearchaeota archaeon]